MLTENQISLLRVKEIQYANKPTLLLKAYNNARTCVFVVDMCDGFCREGALACQNAASIVNPIATLLDFVPDAEKIFLVDRHTEGSAEFKTFPPHCATPRECAVVKPLARFAKRVVFKNSVNGIFAVEKEVDYTAFDQFLIVGCCTDLCVLQLALSLKARLDEDDLLANVIVLADCVATYDAPEHDAVLSSVFAFSLMETAGVKIFKKLS